MNMRKIQYILSGITLITLPLGVHAQQQAKDSTVSFGGGPILYPTGNFTGCA